MRAGDGPVRDISFSPDVTLGEALRRLTNLFAEAGLDTPATDARFLVQGLLNAGAAELFKTPDRGLGMEAQRLERAARRRLAGEPVSRITGWRGFYGREFVVTPDVLDPRPDTEAVIETVLEIAKCRGWCDRPVRFADIGTGSGIILVTLLSELPNATGIGTDVSAPALAVARQNAERHGVAARAQFSHGRGLQGAPPPFDLIVSNPPYIRSSAIGTLAPEVRCFDPRIALDGGDDGLEVYREIAMDFRTIPAPFVTVFEVGAGQSEAVAAIMGAALGAAKLGPLRSSFDLGGRIRCVAMEIH